MLAVRAGFLSDMRRHKTKTVAVSVAHLERIQASLKEHNQREAEYRRMIFLLTHRPDPRLGRRMERQRMRQAVRRSRHARFVLGHPIATWFVRSWTKRGRQLNRRKYELEHALRRKRREWADAVRAELRRVGAADLRRRFREWDRAEDIRVRRETLKDFRLMEPSLTSAVFNRRMAERAVRVSDLPIVGGDADAR